MSEVRFKVEYNQIVITEHFPLLPKRIQQMIISAIEERVAVDPVGLGKPLQYSWKGHRRLRVSNYRIIYRVDLEKKIVTIVAIDHRKDVYG
jgi:mRNA interferase RelE/StbE